MAKTSITLPITASALRRLGTEAKALGVTPEALAARQLSRGFGVPAARVIANVLDDAKRGAAGR
jgi:hypothetical protein